MSDLGSAPGFYGKLPARGDFVGRRFDRKFVDGWDQWLQRAIPASRSALGERWTDIYLNSPIWRLAMAAGICGPDPMAGVMIPSVDSVGRFFPLIVGAKLAPGSDIIAVARDSGRWFGAIETLTLAALEPDFALERMDHPMDEAPDSGWPGDGGGAATASTPIRLCFAGKNGGEVAPAALDMMREISGAASLWWTDGSELVAPATLIATGMPHAQGYSAMLDGAWETHGWTLAVIAADADAETSSEPT